MDDELKATLFQLLTVVEGTRADVRALDTKLSTRIDDVESRLSARIDDVESRLSARIDESESRLSARIDTVADNVEQLRHVTSANYFKVVGRIEQVASMLADHMADHDHDPADRKRA